jgi:hypothetical protein
MRTLIIGVVLLALSILPANAGIYIYQCGDDIVFVSEWPNHRYEFGMRDPKTGHDYKIRPEEKRIQFTRKPFALSKDGKECEQRGYEH